MGRPYSRARAKAGEQQPRNPVPAAACDQMSVNGERCEAASRAHQGGKDDKAEIVMRRNVREHSAYLPVSQHAVYACSLNEPSSSRPFSGS
jgi:hypothetical protein